MVSVAGVPYGLDLELLGKGIPSETRPVIESIVKAHLDLSSVCMGHGTR